MSPLGLVFGLLTAIGWGTSDFLAGFAVRRAQPLAVVLVAQIVALLIAVPLFVASGERIPSAASTAWAIGAGIAGFCLLRLLYAGFAKGAMGPVVALSSVVGVGLPIVVGPLTGDHLRPNDVFGIGFGVAAILFVTRPGAPSSLGRTALTLAILSGIAAGGYFVMLRESSLVSAGPWWTIVVSRTVMLTAALMISAGNREIRSTIATVALPMAGIGVADLTATTFFILANGQGALSIATVLVSQSPALTTAFAWIFVGQRLSRAQAIGIVAALIGVGLIALP